RRRDLLLALRRPSAPLAWIDPFLPAPAGQAAASAKRSAALAALERHAEALADFEAALAAGPNPIVFYNRGLALAALGRPAEAVASYDRTLVLMANHAGAWSSRGVALQALNRHADAIASFDRAIALEPDFADAHFNKSLALLAIGDYPRGQAEYEWRWK